jgi:hypothetical protein
MAGGPLGSTHERVPMFQCPICSVQMERVEGSFFEKWVAGPDGAASPEEVTWMLHCPNGHRAVLIRRPPEADIVRLAEQYR